MTTTTGRPFAQAYAVGSRLVHDGTARTGMECRRRYPQPARTAIGFADGGKRLILAVVEDDPGTPMHGLDADQTARLMHDLGASEAYMFDGSGSTEMLARLPRSSALSLRNYPADGLERPMPVGFGIFRR
jgi:exopolysaccharide biosynthesis protein